MIFEFDAPQVQIDSMEREFVQNIAFLRQVARLRKHVRPYFDVGEMARPLQLPHDLPKVKADWGWGGGNWWVTTPTLLTGAWRLPREDRVLLVFVNVGDQPVRTEVAIDAGENPAILRGADELLASGYLWEENRKQLAFKPLSMVQRHAGRAGQAAGRSISRTRPLAESQVKTWARW